MESEDRKLLKKLLEKVEENNSILRKLRNIARWRRWSRILYWTAIIALTFGAYYYIQPLLENLSGVYGNLGGGADGGGLNIKTLQDVSDALKGGGEASQ